MPFGVEIRSQVAPWLRADSLPPLVRANMELNWLYRRFGDEFGPVSFDTLQELRQSGQLDDDDLVRKTSENDWRMAAMSELVHQNSLHRLRLGRL